MTAKQHRPGAVRKKSKGTSVGSGGKGRRALRGRGPTPKAEDRPYHPKAKEKAAKERRLAAQERRSPAAGARSRVRSNESDLVTGRNAVLEALRARVPATALYVASKVAMDDRMREIVGLAVGRDIPVMEVMRQELDRMTSADTVHQGVLIKVPEYEYAHPDDLVERAIAANETPLIVALDGVTDPRNLGAIVRSVGAFGGHGVIVPQRRSVGMNAAAWKTSAGAAARIPVAMATNLTQTLKSLQAQGLFIVGLDGDGDVPLPDLDLVDEPIVVVVGSEGKGLSRLVSERCDAIVSIPISSVTESLNAGIAASVALYDISQRRASRPAS